jgi:hypothetical protein
MALSPVVSSLAPVITPPPALVTTPLVFTDTTVNPVLVPGATDPTVGTLTVNPFSDVAATDTGSGAVLTVALSPEVAGQSTGALSDPTGAGTLTGTTFTETAVDPGSNISQILARLVYVQPKDTIDGTSRIIDAHISASDGGTTATDSTDVQIEIVTAPTITGTTSNEVDSDLPILPFATTVIADTDFGNTALDSATITLSSVLGGVGTDANGLLNGAGVTHTGVGTYTIAAASPAALTSDLQSLQFTPVVGVADHTTFFKLDVLDARAGLDQLDTETSDITPGTAPIPIGPVGVTATDTTTNTPIADPATTPYTGPVVGITSQYINVSADSLNIMASTPNWFLHSGSGEDALQASSGTNVLDGGTGSNFLTGGAGGKDTFFVDARGATAPIWSTMSNFHSGDDATMFGITPSAFNIAMANGEGATGFTGLTFHATAPGAPAASLTLVGFTIADLTNGKLSQSFGTDPVSGSSFMLLHAN